MEKRITKQEKEILELLEQNLDNKEIAEKLYISVHTVKSHLSKISKMKKS